MSVCWARTAHPHRVLTGVALFYPAWKPWMGSERKPWILVEIQGDSCGFCTEGRLTDPFLLLGGWPCCLEASSPVREEPGKILSPLAEIGSIGRSTFHQRCEESLLILHFFISHARTSKEMVASHETFANRKGKKGSNGQNVLALPFSGLAFPYCKSPFSHKFKAMTFFCPLLRS